MGMIYSKTCVKRPFSKRLKIGFQDQYSLNAGQKYYRMVQGEHSVILLTCIKLPFVIKTFVLSIFEWPFYTGFTVMSCFKIYKPVVINIFCNIVMMVIITLCISGKILMLSIQKLDFNLL